jgi:RNA polymerase sigma-70 factor (ECF subfamily)
MSLASTYRAHAASPLPDPQLESALAALVARARAEWPHLAAHDTDLVAQVARRSAEVALDALHAGDLLLAVGCARGERGALEAYESRYLRAHALGAALARIDSSPSFADEVRQVVREKILVAPAGREPRIAEYSGRGSLAAWTRVVAMRAALDLRPARAAEAATDSPPDLGGERDPELGLLQERYGKAFEEALAEAFAALSDEQSNLLKLQIVDGLQTARIAALFHVDRSTIKRRLASCRETLLQETRRILAERLKVSPESFESLARMVQSQLHVSVARLLKNR